MKDVSIGGLTVGNDRPLLVIAGPCQLESLDHAQMIAGQMIMPLGIAGVFIETHEEPDSAHSNGPNMIVLSQMPTMINSPIQFNQLANRNRSGSATPCFAETSL